MKTQLGIAALLAACGGTGTTNVGGAGDGGRVQVGATTDGGSAQPDIGTATRAVVLDFDSFAGAVMDPYPDAHFSAGHLTLADADYFHSSQPNFVCSTASCREPTSVTFPVGVSALSFSVVGVGSAGAFATLDVYTGGSLTSSIPLVGEGENRTPLRIDLSKYTNVTQIAVHDITDPDGVGYDDFHFAVAVP